MKLLLLHIILCLSAMHSYAQQFPDRHSTSFTDAWLSCTISANPNTDRGESHWIRYDLGETYVLGAFTLWNYNDPNNLDNGVQDIAIDVSSDGVNWTEAAIASVSISQGSAYYEGADIIDLGGITADYILITILSNHGGTCSGFSEMRISSSTVLPIELSHQEVNCVSEEEAVKISWQTASEVGNYFFTIQKSNDAIDWVDQIEIDAKGSSGQGAYYNYLDKNVSGSHYYRIVNTDLDGRHQYFDVMFLDCDELSDMNMTVANPFSETLVIQYVPMNSGDVQYTVESLNGLKIYNEKTANNISTLSIPSSEWAPGAYIITIQQNKKSIVKKVVKI